MADETEMDDLKKPDTIWSIVRRLGLFLGIAVLAVVVTHCTNLGDYFHVDAITALSARLGAWGPVLLIALGIFTPLLFIPRWPIAFVGGLLYGVVWGTVIATFGSALGALLHYYLSRTLLAPFSERIRRKMNWVGPAIPKDKQILALFLMRAFPLSNFVATNMMAGALKLHSMRYFYGSILGMIPSSLMYASWGKLMKQPSPWFYAVAVLSLLMIVLGAIYGRRWLARWQRDAAVSEVGDQRPEDSDQRSEDRGQRSEN